MPGAIRRVVTEAGHPAWLVGGYQEVRALLSDPRLGRSHHDPESAARLSRSVTLDRPLVASESERDDHRDMRRLVLSRLSGTSAKLLEPRIRQVVADVLDTLTGHGPPADFRALVSEPLPALVICEVLGVPQAHRTQLVAWSADAGQVADERRSAAGFTYLVRYMAALLARRDPAADDLLGSLARAYPAGVAARAAADLFIAGHQTTSAAIDKGIVLLLSTPDGLRDTLRQAESVATAIEEIVRLPDPVAAAERSRLLPRYASAEIDLDGVTVRPGDLVLLAVDEANCDERVFDDPGTPDFTRRPNPHLGFGYGRFACTGATLARTELRLLFEALPDRVPGLRLAVPAAQLRSRSDQLMGGIVSLPVRW